MSRDAPRSIRQATGVVGVIKPRLMRWVSAARAWRWGAVIARATLGCLGLVVLGAIGHSAFARNVLAPPPSLASPPALPAPAGDPTAATVSAQVVLPLVLAPDLAAGVAVASGAQAEAPQSPLPGPAQWRATPEDPVYLNQATLADLHRLPGIGPKRAEAILALRTRLGHFRQIEDLLKVKGVGRSSLKKLRPLVRLDPPPAAAPPTPATDAGVK